MSQFNFSQYQEAVEKAQNKSIANSNAVRIGFFKLKEDSSEALVRFNCSTVKDLKFASVHKPIFGKKFEGLGSGFTPVSCLNELGSTVNTCPFCRAAEENHEIIAKASKVVYLEMLVAYKDPATGGWSQAIPVVWERPAGFSKELAAKIRDYGDLKKIVFKIMRQGTGTDTRYSLDFIPIFNKPELVPEDFSAFANFNINKHSYWEKSAGDMETYLATGTFTSDDEATSTQVTSDTTSSTTWSAPIEEPPFMKDPTSAPVTTNTMPITPTTVTKAVPTEPEATTTDSGTVRKFNFKF